MRAPCLRTLLSLLLVALPVAAAADGVVVKRLAGPEPQWTPERILSARPMPMPSGRLEADEPIDQVQPERGERSIGQPGRAPAVLPPVELERVLVDEQRLRARPSRARRGSAGHRSGDLEVSPRNRGTRGLDFTSSRLVPEDARFAYPYSAAGKLFFSIPGEGDFICSGAVISARVVLTAGHCVYGSGEFFEDFLFVPAYREGEAPFGAWTANFVATTGSWANGDDEVPNEQDVAVLAINDQQVSTTGAGGASAVANMKIGDVTGWLGYITKKMTPNHVKMLGYPGNHDRGERMHQVDSSSSECCFTNNALFGADMGGGASGGPWIQNFGTKAKGQKGGKNKKLNRVVGVTSCGPINANEQFLCASELNSEGVAVINAACNNASGNCRKKGRPQS